MYVRENKEFPKFAEMFALSLGFPGGSDGKESACNAGDPSSIPPVFLSGECYGQRSLVGYNPWGHKELDMTKCLPLSHGLEA